MASTSEAAAEREVRAAFAVFDEDKSGKVDMSEYLRFSLREALLRSQTRVVDLFRQWDEDDSGTIDKKEFRRAMPLLGLDVPRAEVDALFDSWDPDGSGSLEIPELNKVLRRGAEVPLDKIPHPAP